MYLDKNKRISFTEAAWTKLKSYTLAHPDIYFDRVMELQPLNFAIFTPFGVRANDGVFMFAGKVEFADVETAPMLYLSDGPNSGKPVTTPVFPDPTFGGLLPGMTGDKLMSLLISTPA